MNMRALTIVVSVVVVGIAILYGIGELRAYIGQRKRAHIRQAAQMHTHAFDSPEHHTQIMAMIRQLDEELAERSKRLPERVATTIIFDEEREILSRQQESETSNEVSE